MIASAAGLTRAALYKAPRPGEETRFDTIAGVCLALGLKVAVQATNPVTRLSREVVGKFRAIDTGRQACVDVALKEGLATHP